MAIESGVYVDLVPEDAVNLRNGLKAGDGTAVTLDDGVLYAVQNLGYSEVFLAERTDAEGKPVGHIEAVRKLAVGDDLAIKLKSGRTIWAYTLGGGARLGVTESV